MNFLVPAYFEDGPHEGYDAKTTNDIDEDATKDNVRLNTGWIGMT